ncbi:magnesium/cobalt transporter CorA [Pararhodonellum marinum]|uniref:magnesium/cobalt transporter CorA n=1 Tax=Pararhodonellum marinum TaxID=2755358 RepID=UPI001E3908EF|nr:magnesium/cobalt transporter CorA [Pararhodonellum marinum]
MSTRTTHPDLSEQPIIMELYQFGENHFQKANITHPDQIKPFLEQPHKFWLNVSGIHDLDLMNQLSEIFQFHVLVLEDIINLYQRPKIEVFEEHVLVVTKMIYCKGSLSDLKCEQISLLFGDNFILTVQENPYDIFDSIRTRLENPSGKMRKLGTDYFAYTLLDKIVDGYFDIIEQISDATEDLESEIIDNKKRVKLHTIYQHKKSIQEMKRNAWPMREILSLWQKSESRFLKKRTHHFINDLYEHIIEIIENLETQRESITSLVEIYMTQLSIKQNEVMKTLTVIATIFIPLTFIAGVYGMNFTHMPELEWPYGYSLVWGVFLLVTLAMVYYFKKNRWF